MADAPTPHGDDVEARLAAALARAELAEAGVAALEDAIISADDEFDGDSDHPSPKARFVASVYRLRDKARASRHLAAELAALRAEVARLREALGLADAALSGANMNMKHVWRKIKAALAEWQNETAPAEAFTNADWFWRTMDPDDCGGTPEEAIRRAMLGYFCVCEIASSYAGPTRYGFIAPVLDPESDDDEFVHFATQQEAIDAAKARAALEAK